MADFEHNLKSNQVKAIKCLMTEPSVKAAARKARVSESSLRRWLSQPEFCAALREARGRALEAVLTTMQGLGEEALTTLRQVMNDPEAHPGSRVKAALGVLATIIKSREVLETEERLRAIEERLNEIGAKK